MSYETQSTKSINEAKSIYQQEYAKTAKGKENRNKAFKNWQANHHDEYLKYQQLYSETRKYASQHLPGGIPQGYCLHHAFGMDRPHDFLLLPVELHKALHSRFGRRNDQCLWSNPEVGDFLRASGKPFYVFYNNRIKVAYWDLF